MVGGTRGPAVTFLWDHGETTELVNGHASAINDSGQVVGYLYKDDPLNNSAFLWDDGDLIDLGSPPGGRKSFPHDVNSSDEVVGSYQKLGNNSKSGAFLWKDDQMTGLGTLGGSESWGRGINDSGQIVGRSKTDDGKYYPFLYEDVEMHNLSDLVVGDRLGQAGARGITSGQKTSSGLRKPL